MRATFISRNQKDKTSLKFLRETFAMVSCLWHNLFVIGPGVVQFKKVSNRSWLLIAQFQASCLSVRRASIVPVFTSIFLPSRNGRRSCQLRKARILRKKTATRAHFAFIIIKTIQLSRSSLYSQQEFTQFNHYTAAKIDAKNDCSYLRFKTAW